MTSMMLRYSRRLASTGTSLMARRAPWSQRGAVFSTSSSSFDEPNPSLFHQAPASISATDDPDAQLRSDIKVMGSVLGSVIRQHTGNDVFVKVEEMRALAGQWRNNNKQGSLSDLADFASQLSSWELQSVARAFTHFLSIANSAEAHHRIRRLTTTDSDTTSGLLFPHKPDSCGGVIPDLLAQGHSRSEILQAVSSQTVELVLTAHPTEVNRRTVLDKKRRIQDILTAADALQGHNSFEQQQHDQALQREVGSIWLTDEVARTKPTAEQEAEKGTLVLETVLWDALPQFLRKLSACLESNLGEPLPLEAAPLRFASWMGGDRDGNPNVTAPTTRAVCWRHRKVAATLLRRELQALRSELSIWTASQELLDLIDVSEDDEDDDEDMEDSTEMKELNAMMKQRGYNASRDDKLREPYRFYLKDVIEKLDDTISWANDKLDAVHMKTPPSVMGDDEEHLYYTDSSELLEDLLVVHRSLVETGNEITADGRLTDIIRNLQAFGLTLAPLDIRQESTRHEEAVTAICSYLGMGDYSHWDEATKVAWLINQISTPRPLIRPGCWKDHPEVFSDTVAETLETFQVIAEQPEGSLGAYVISQATTASDVLAVLLLQLDAGVKKPLRVVPLFETLDDLNGATSTMRQLFGLPVYMGFIKGKQEVMIGYSDSAKDAGRLAANWAQYETQENLAAVAKEFDIDMTFFHGKGGTDVLGKKARMKTWQASLSHSALKAIMAHAPNTINGQFRVTEQGEMINQNFGYGDRAERTLDLYTAAVLAEKLSRRPGPSETWREMMGKLSDLSCEAYRKIVRHDERFVPYFRSATPELELTGLNIGSRPAKRKATGGVESLRAIPWNFAWTQTRLNLPTWLGVGSALKTILSNGQDAPVLREMYRDWPSFRMMIDLVEMVLAKSEPEIAKHYEDVLVKDSLAKELGVEVRMQHLETEKMVLDLTEHSQLGENNKVLMRQLQVRNRYVDCLNVLQAETLRRLRDPKSLSTKEKALLDDALLTTITGVANGMGNTG